jgi:hypothetical protein
MANSQVRAPLFPKFTAHFWKYADVQHLRILCSEAFCGATPAGITTNPWHLLTFDEKTKLAQAYKRVGVRLKILGFMWNNMGQKERENLLESANVRESGDYVLRKWEELRTENQHYFLRMISRIPKKQTTKA